MLAADALAAATLGAGFAFGAAATSDAVFGARSGRSTIQVGIFNAHAKSRSNRSSKKTGGVLGSMNLWPPGAMAREWRPRPVRLQFFSCAKVVAFSAGVFH